MPRTETPAATAHPVDVHVGRRIRNRRKSVGMTQNELADRLGLTFQQVQKYEKGANRISASKLWEATQALRTHVTYFFDGLTGEDEQAGVAEQGAPFGYDFLQDDEAVELAESFTRIENKALRRQILNLIRTMARSDGPAPAD